MINSYLKKKDKPQINNLISHLKKLEKEEQTKSKVSRRKEIKIRAGAHETETETHTVIPLLVICAYRTLEKALWTLWRGNRKYCFY